MTRVLFHLETHLEPHLYDINYDLLTLPILTPTNHFCDASPVSAGFDFWNEIVIIFTID